MAIKLLSQFLVILVVLVSLFVNNLVLASEQYKDPIVIGMSAAFTGASKNLGLELYHGSMAYINKINQSGGINGHPLVIKAYDDGYNPLPAIENTVNLVEEDEVTVLFDYVGDPTVTKILPLLKKYEAKNIMLFFPFTGAQSMRQVPYNQYVVNLRASYREETAGLVDHLLGIGHKRIAVFYQIDAYGRSGWDGVRKALEKYGLDIVAETTYRRGTEYNSSFNPQVQILQEADPDAIISIGNYQACAGFIRDARDANWDIPIANVSLVGSESLLKLLLETGRKTQRDYTQNLINSEILPSYEDLSLPAVKEYRNAINSYRGKSPITKENYTESGYNYVSFEGFLNAKLMVEILKRWTDFSDQDQLHEIVDHLNDFDLGIGVSLQFKHPEHQGLHQVYYTTVSNNKFVPLKDWRKWSK
ncbi:Extracellular ligand-binding receptor [Rippkaea orientalis PCC 8801]|uniref:Extracellular ligand-binding receptor n=1 Tax=Rippkaea orientalis (strain PCC 8801 / RF-1) TaxID=41431 RepID=B7K0T9_RIPO1|nr:ABC transporter substrate-binding protein [Rippkaea orientalis]ACK65080.1 Extracellular ligand-binding receptor [Rippkaea orientalis PCC 8801]